MKRHWQHLFVFFLILTCIGLVSGCAKKQIESQPTDVGTEVTSEEMQVGPSAEEQKSMEESLSKAEEYQLQQAQAEAEAEAARKAEKMARQEDRAQLKGLIHFAFDSYELNPQARQSLKEKAAILRNRMDIELTIEGHCDERGTEEYNLALGERRARAAYEFLVLLGVSPDRLNIISYGEEKPLDPGHSEEAWAMNRRAQFRIMN